MVSVRLLKKEIKNLPRDEQLKILWDVIRRMYWERSRISRSVDLAQTAVRTYPPTDIQGLLEWIKRKGVGVDIEGLDTRSAKTKVKFREWKHKSPRARAGHKGGVASQVKRKLPLYFSSVDDLLAELETSNPMPEDRAREYFRRIAKQLENELKKVDEEIEKMDTINNQLSRLYVVVRKTGWIDDFQGLIKDIRILGLNRTGNYFWEGKIKTGLSLEDAKAKVEALMDLLNKSGIMVETLGKDGRPRPLDREEVEKLYHAVELVSRDKAKVVAWPDHDRRLYYDISEDEVKDLLNGDDYRTKMLFKDVFCYEVPVYDPYLRSRTTKEYCLGWDRNGIYYGPRGLVPELEINLRNNYRSKGKFYIAFYAPWVKKLFLADSPVRLRDYQTEAVAWILKYLAKYGAGTLMAATGAGKTEMAIDVVSRLLNTIGKKPSGKILYVSLSSDLLRQFKNRAKKYGIDVGLIASGSDFEVDKPVIAVTIQTLARVVEKVEHEKNLIEKVEDVKMDEAKNLKMEQYRKLYDILKNAKLIVVDEAHHVPARTVSAVLKRSPSSLKIGLSATPWRDDEKDKVIYAWVGSIVPYRISSSYLIRKGWLVPPIIYMVKPILAPWEGHYANWQSELSRVMNSPERAEFIAGILEGLKERGYAPGLVLVRLVNQAKLIAEKAREHGLKLVAVTGELKPEEREKYFKDIMEGRLDFIVATTLADEGLDLPPIRSLIIAGAGKSKTKVFQRIGRVLRPWKGKRFGVVIDIVDMNTNYLEEHGLKREELYRDEPLWTVRDVEINVKDSDPYEKGKEVIEGIDPEKVYKERYKNKIKVKVPLIAKTM